jgi:hypothetical protein
MSRLREGYGTARLPLWYFGLRDRLRGEHARANARWGYLHPPPGRGRVLWIKSGSDARSVRLGAELLAAIRERRRDLRLVLSFERAYPEHIAPRLEGIKKVAVGYGPCDAPAAVRRSLARLDPFALLYVGAAPGANLLDQAQSRGLHVVAYDAPLSAECGIEASYPASEADARAWGAGAGARYVAPAADALTLLTTAQVDPVLCGLAGGPRELRSWWLHGLETDAAVRVVACWVASPLARAGLLFVSAERPVLDLEPALHGRGIATLRIGRWQRGPVDAGTVLLVDDERWLPAVAAASAAIHLGDAGREVLWQALAGGAPTSLASTWAAPAPPAASALPRAASAQEVIDGWSRLLENPLDARRGGDACRRAFWAERRRARAVLEELLQRVFDW